MKKIGFALQVFGLITMFPLCVILEMNHAATTLPANNTTSGNNQIQVQSIPKPITNSFADFGSQYLVTEIL
ncbi:MAG: hypothetical protein LH615_08950, partial [Ferruginibacter sp.]|nr:hypothetical protein [Ferruginibacter sp.]